MEHPCRNVGDREDGLAALVARVVKVVKVVKVVMAARVGSRAVSPAPRAKEALADAGAASVAAGLADHPPRELAR